MSSGGVGAQALGESLLGVAVRGSEHGYTKCIKNRIGSLSDFLWYLEYLVGSRYLDSRCHHVGTKHVSPLCHTSRLRLGRGTPNDSPAQPGLAYQERLLILEWSAPLPRAEATKVPGYIWQRWTIPGLFNYAQYTPAF